MRNVRPILAVLALAMAPCLPAQVPAILHYQGRILVGSSAFDGQGRFKFALVDAAGATSYWRNSPDTDANGEPDTAVLLPVSRGLYSVLLGDTTQAGMAAFPPSFPTGEVFLRVWFDDGTNGLQRLTPDQRVASVAYALVAGSVPDGSITAAQLAPGALRAADLTGALLPSQIPALDAAVLSTGTVAAERLPSNLAWKDRDVDGLAASVTAQYQQLQAQFAGLEARLAILASDPGVAAGVVRASLEAEDATLLASGYLRMATLPSTPWRSSTSSDGPGARQRHGSVWLAGENALAVWGGEVGAGAYSGFGALYRPELDTWTPITSSGAPSARRGHAMVADGAHGFLVWGGYEAAGYANTGARYDVSRGDWAPMSLAQAPSAREGQVGILAGSRFIVWGGRSGAGFLEDGAGYDLASDTWTPLPAAGVPSARANATAVWTGNRLLIWGGTGASGPEGTGRQLIFQDGAGGLQPVEWREITGAGALSARSGHTALWTGRRMLVWGGRTADGVVGDGASYDPLADRWSALSSQGAPTPRGGHVALWTGSEMLVMTGESGGSTLATGAAYDPALDRWRPLTLEGLPQTRSEATAVWTGSEAVLFGGQSGGGSVAALQRLVAQPTWHLYRKLQP